MVRITMEGEGDTVIEALWDLSLNVEAAIKRAQATGREHVGEADDR